ncbi:hypothetical protein Tco_0257677, partial [Tanacetum coccineum]
MKTDCKLMEPGFELIAWKWVEIWTFSFVRLETPGLQGFKASIFLLIIVLGTSLELLEQRFAAIVGYRRRCGG